MKRLIISVCMATALYFQSAAALEVAGVNVPDSIQHPSGTELTLNGAGTRSKFFVSVYVGALYLSESATTTDAVLAQTDPNRVAMHFLYAEVSAKKLVAGWNDGFQDNHQESELTVLQPRIDQFNALFPTVKKGNVVLVDYTPGTGTSCFRQRRDKGHGTRCRLQPRPAQDLARETTGQRELEKSHAGRQQIVASPAGACRSDRWAC